MDLKTLSQLVTCPVCWQIPKCSKMLVCANGHNICPACAAKVDLCPTGRCAFDAPARRNLTAEAIMERLDFEFACANAEDGCEVVEVRSRVEEHERECPYRVVPCPEGE